MIDKEKIWQIKLKLKSFVSQKRIQIGMILAGLIILFGVVLLVRHKRNHIHDLPDIMESGRLSVLTDSSRMGFSTRGDSVFGFQYEIVKAFADSLGLELVVTEKTDLSECVEDLKSGDYDIIANFTPITTEWKKEVLYTVPLFTSRQVLVQKLATDSTKSKFISNHFQLANDTIYIPYHSPNKMRLNHLSDEIASPIHILEVKNLSSEQMVRLVSMGKIKYTICDEQIARKLKLQFANIDVSFPIGFEQQQAWVVHLKSPLLQLKLNDFLQDFIGSSAYWTIYRKYY
jgi:membrane-bound lytic murein transglycosylase F